MITKIITTSGKTCQIISAHFGENEYVESIFFEIKVKSSHNQFFLTFEQDMAQIAETNS